MEMPTNRSSANGSEGAPDAMNLPEQRVGAALRDARRAAGLSLREVARRLNYASHSTLSEYENGARMPSEPVVEGYERLLRLEHGVLTAILEDANIERHGDAWAKRRVHIPLQLPAADLPPADSTAAPGAAGCQPASPWPEQPVADGSDPDAAGCSADAVTIHSRRIALTGERTIIGHIELRYSSRARAAWGRFEGYGLLDHLAGRRNDVDIVVEVVRESDATVIATKEHYCFDYVWGELVVVDSGAFQARATVLIGDEAVAAGQTDARRLA
jgi:transcriptional regulator with XRE-family HTH domain